jgi:hypothetical protein
VFSSKVKHIRLLRIQSIHNYKLVKRVY